jgi:hypothetical protein
MLVKTNLPVASRAGSTERGALQETDNAAEEQFAWGDQSGCLGPAGQPTRSSPKGGMWRPETSRLLGTTSSSAARIGGRFPFARKAEET